MERDYEHYERACEAIREENAALLNDFSGWLRNKGLADSTIRTHRNNIDFFVNNFLLYEEATPASGGADSVGMFLGYWFIRKAMWASAATIRSNAASLKKFYGFMVERGLVDQAKLTELRETIKYTMPEWLGKMDRYDDPSIVDPAEVWDL